ncbi:MAG: UDP-2,4-diacetamido-2,4,6-trideoxy-beta-L-altropyranose hydrolase [Methyloglobulus sp.]|nr:UDP-2,4-diacetamido-2,4,6-trideoxy-beta-L-altropyranose hydrolase [Methyloglobulus sp.]
MIKKVAIRVDASLHIGTGHVMRCLTLGNALRVKGAEVVFITRQHPRNLIGFIQQKGFVLHQLPLLPDGEKTTETGLPQKLMHSQWLGVSQHQDALECIPLLQEIQPDWLVIDQYAIDCRWQGLLKPYYKKLMVIDDLADRQHECDVLLDQNLGRKVSDYRELVPANARLLLGTDFALLRPEFTRWRDFSLKRRATKPELKHLLITMGGIDTNNVTGRVLTVLKDCALPSDLKITVVMGGAAPWLEQVKQQAAQMPNATEVKVNVANMAEIMADSDLAIGAAGSTSWERCCLGLPTLMVVLADNQLIIANALERTNAAYLIGDQAAIVNQLPVLMNQAMLSSVQLAAMSHAASAIVDGAGVERVIALLEIN